jgi:acyl-CoA thioesterase FadM
MSKPIEEIGIEETGLEETPVPFVYRRIVRWGDCDIARIIYTTRVFDYGMEALEEWYGKVAGFHWYKANAFTTMGTPFVHVSGDIKSPLVCGDEVLVRVLVTQMGRSSLHYAVDGHRPDGTVAFTSKFVASIIDTTLMKSREIPPGMRARIEEYRRRCDEGLAASEKA